MPEQSAPKRHRTILGWPQGKFVRRLTEPDAAIQDSGERSQARLLATLLAAFIPLAFLSIVIQLFTVPGFTRIAPPLFLSLFIIIAAYVLSRSRFYKFGAAIAIAIPFLAVFVNIVIDPRNPDTLFFLILSIMLSSILLPPRWIAVFALVALFGMIILAAAIPELGFADIAPPVVLSFLMTALILVFVRHRDLLERIRRAELAKSENRWRLLVSQSPFSTVIYSPDGRVLTYNQAAIDLWGLSDDDLEFMKTTYNILQDDQLEASGTLPYIRRAFAGQATVAPPSEYEFQRMAVDGSFVTDKRWITAHCYPVKDDMGQVYEIVLVHEDITERKEAEEALRQSERRATALLQAIPDMMFRMNREGVYLDYMADDSELYARSGETVIGRNNYDITPPEFANLVDRKIKETLESGTIQTFEYQMPMAGRGKVDYEARMVKSGADEVIAIVRDITEAKQIDTVVRRQERLSAVGQLAAGIAHDFNNVMAVITLYTDIMLKSAELAEEERRKLDVIRQQAMHAAELTGQILDFGRQSVMERRPVGLLRFLREFVTFIERTLPENIKINLEFGADDYVVNADLTRIEQALINLVLNARDAMPEGGVIGIELDKKSFRPEDPIPSPNMKRGEWVKLELSDRGVGISPEVMPHLFEPFFTTKEQGLGTGLGLAQVYGIVKQHEGYIFVDSQLGWGTTLTLFFPAFSLEKTEAGFPDAVVSLRYGNGELVLVVEDNNDTRKVLVEGLEFLNYRVIIAENGLNALGKIEVFRDKIGLIVCDMVMPEMGGMALLEALSQRGINVPVLLLTGHLVQEELGKLQARGFNEWMMKPVSLDVLAETVGRLVNN